MIVPVVLPPVGAVDEIVPVVLPPVALPPVIFPDIVALSPVICAAAELMTPNPVNDRVAPARTTNIVNIVIVFIACTRVH
jgi:hypothetical protein